MTPENAVHEGLPYDWEQRARRRSAALIISSYPSPPSDAVAEGKTEAPSRWAIALSGP
jgi:hypothetical protein